MTTFYQKTTSAPKWSALDLFMRQGVQFIVSIVLARLLSPEDFGVIAMLAFFIGVANIFIGNWFSSALIQRPNITHIDESTVFYFNIGMGAVAALMLCSAAPWITSFFKQPMLQYLTYAMAFNLFVNTFGSIHSTLLRKEINFKTTAKVGLASSIVAGVAAIFMASQGYGVWSLVGHSVVSGIVTVFFLWRWHPWRPAWLFSVGSLGSFFRFGSYMMATTLIDVFATNLYSIMIGKMYSTIDVGFYDRAKRTQLPPTPLLFIPWLANTGVVAYPTNLLSRFYGAPVVGAQIQLLLADPRFNFRDEILVFTSAISFNSENGKTKGAPAPNEFWYFWRRFLPFGELDWLSDEEPFRIVDQEKLVAELTTLTRLFGKPFALKSMILNYNIPFLDTIFEKALCVHIKRDPVTDVVSILDTRKRKLGSEDEWYSFIIPEYSRLNDLDPATQSAGQLHYINKAVTQDFSTVDESNKLVVRYEDFCQNPRRVFEELTEKLKLDGRNSRGPEGFRVTRNSNSANLVAIEEALAGFTNQ